MSRDIKDSKAKQYWRTLMNSPKLTLSRGSASICRSVTTCAHGEGWRRKDHARKASPKK